MDILFQFYPLETLLALLCVGGVIALGIWVSSRKRKSESSERDQAASDEEDKALRQLVRSLEERKAQQQASAPSKRRQ